MATELAHLGEMLEMLRFLDAPDVVTKSQADMRRALRAAVRGLFEGYFDRFDFVDQFRAALMRGLTMAWHAGAAQCGIKPDEFSDAETSALQNMIYSQVPYAGGFADEIIRARELQRVSGPVSGTLNKFFARADVWVNTYNQAQNMAQVMSCGDQKLVWIRGNTKQPCGTCRALDGKVKRASQWEQSGLRPQGHTLECGGFNCRCSLQPTDAPMSRGPLPFTTLRL